MRVRVCLGAIPIPEYLDFHSGYSAPRSRIAGIYSGMYSFSGISQTNVPFKTSEEESVAALLVNFRFYSDFAGQFLIFISLTLYFLLAQFVIVAS